MGNMGEKRQYGDEMIKAMAKKWVTGRGVYEDIDVWCIHQRHEDHCPLLCLSCILNYYNKYYHCFPGFI